MQWTDEAVVLRIGKFRETDLWVRFLSREKGLVTAFAFGGSRSRRRNRCGSRSQLHRSSNGDRSRQRSAVIAAFETDISVIGFDFDLGEIVITHQFDQIADLFKIHNKNSLFFEAQAPFYCLLIVIYLYGSGAKPVRAEPVNTNLCRIRQ